MESLEEILIKTKESAKRVILTATALSLIGMSTVFYINYYNNKKENEKKEQYQETLLKSLSSISPEFEDLKDTYRYLMYKMYQKKENIEIVPYELFFQVYDTFPDIVVEVPHKKGTGLLYLFIMDERRKKDIRLHNAQDDDYKTKMIRLINVDENLEDGTRRRLLYITIDSILNEAEKFYNE